MNAKTIHLPFDFRCGIVVAMKTQEHPLAAYRRLHGVSQVAFAARLGVQAPAVCKWEKGRAIPAERVAIISLLTGISRRKLRPDLY